MKSKAFILPVLIFLTIEITAQSYIDKTFTNYFRRTGPGWVASDGTISIPLPDGKVLWLFGDTYLDDFNVADTSVPCLFHVRNSMLVQDHADRSKFITILDSTQTGMNRTPVKLSPDDSTVFWPGHGFVKGDTAYVFWFRYNGKTLSHLGNYCAKIYWPGFVNAKGIISLSRLPETHGIEFGNTVITDTMGGYVYVYGRDAGKLFVARFPWDRLFSEWEYFDGKTWTTQVQLVREISPFLVNSGFSVIPHKNKFYVLSQEIGYLTCGMGREIFSLESASPSGPFTGKKILYTIEDKYRGSYLITYNGTAHPEFNTKNEILFSYNVNDICPGSCQNWQTSRWNADLYRPKFVRIPFSLFESKE